MKENKMFYIFVLYLFIFSETLSGQPENTNPTKYNTYVLDNIPIAKTPQYLGLNVEVMKYADRTNIWDWLIESNANMIRAPHPAYLLRKNQTSVYEIYARIRNKEQFEAFRKRIKKNPEKEIEWSYYLFSDELPWMGKPDDVSEKIQACGKEYMMAIDYEPSFYPEPVLLKSTAELHPSDNLINWSAAASAYEYYFACMYRYSLLHNVRYYMMRNEPPLDDNFIIQQFGVLSKMARLAMEDVKAVIKDKKISISLQLVGPATYMAYEEYLQFTKEDIDILDVHFYDTGGERLKQKLRRALMRARQNNLKLSMTEFGRIGGSMDIDQSLFSMKAALQVADIIMEVLSVSAINDPSFELALFYQFQFPATHRNYKSLVYGDMNMVDWTGMDYAPKNNFPEGPAFQQLQLRYPTPAYDIFRMLARCTPGTKTNETYFKIYELMEANRGVTATKEKRTKRNLWPEQDEKKYYANEGRSFDIKTLAVEGDGRLYINILNREPVALNAMKIDISSFHGKYTTAVIRETSLSKRDEPVSQSQVKEGMIDIDIPAESFIQVIFTQEDMLAITQVKLEEVTLTPGDSQKLQFLETTKLKALGKYQDKWIDLSNLNAVYTVDKDSGLKVYSGGLIQRFLDTDKQGKVRVELLTGQASANIMIR